MGELPLFIGLYLFAGSSVALGAVDNPENEALHAALIRSKGLVVAWFWWALAFFVHMFLWPLLIPAIYQELRQKESWQSTGKHRRLW